MPVEDPFVFDLDALRGVYRGESGRNLRPNWAKGGRELHPEGGKNSPRYMGNM